MSGKGGLTTDQQEFELADQMDVAGHSRLCNLDKWSLFKGLPYLALTLGKINRPSSLSVQ